MQTESTPHILSFFLSLMMKPNRNTHQNTLSQPLWLVLGCKHWWVLTAAGFARAAAAVIAV